MKSITIIRRHNIPKDKYGLPLTFIPRLKDGYCRFSEHEDFFNFLKKISKNSDFTLLKVASEVLYYRPGSEDIPLKCEECQLICWVNHRRPTQLFVISLDVNFQSEIVFHKGKKYEKIIDFMCENIPNEFIFHPALEIKSASVNSSKVINPDLNISSNPYLLSASNPKSDQNYPKKGSLLTLKEDEKTKIPTSTTGRHFRLMPSSAEGKPSHSSKIISSKAETPPRIPQTTVKGLS